jgi:hypothetical protein
MAKLQVGQIWLDRSNRIVEIIDFDSGTTRHPFKGDNGKRYTEDGRFFSSETECSLDLVQESTPRSFASISMHVDENGFRQWVAVATDGTDAAWQQIHPLPPKTPTPQVDPGTTNPVST